MLLFSQVENTEKIFSFFIDCSKEIWSWLSDFGTDTALGSVKFQNYDKN